MQEDIAVFVVLGIVSVYLLELSPMNQREGCCIAETLPACKLYILYKSV